VALFIDKLPEGLWEIRYELRAEVPGEFHALPVLGHAMYIPEIRCTVKSSGFVYSIDSRNRAPETGGRKRLAGTNTRPSIRRNFVYNVSF
jgi:hypothetical protein